VFRDRPLARTHGKRSQLFEATHVQAQTGVEVYVDRKRV
jgi:hypothetical protein